jgi:CHAD domain-containing protein
MHDQVELELKYDVPDGWVLPDAARVAPDGASVQVETVRLHSAYYDTLDRDLLRHGVTLRRRTGDDDTGWHLKVPRGDARTELRLPVAGESVPDELVSLVAALSRGERLRVIASLDTVRTVSRLVSSAGTVLVEIADDAVTATATGDAAVIQQWREVEVELGDADEQLLRQSARWLADAGAVPSRSGSKLARAVGAVPMRNRLPAGSLAALVIAHLHEQHRAIVRGDVELRRGLDAVHRTRVATRRFRSVLRIFAELFDEERRQRLDAELKWYAGELGIERDLQVMRRHLIEAAAALPDAVRDRTIEYLSTRLDTDEQAARGRVLEALNGQRYAALLRDVRAFVEEPPAGGDLPAKKVRGYVRIARKKARRRVAAAATPPQYDERTHRARKATKRGRYTAELAAPVLGPKAEQLAERHKAIQDELGELQDAVVAAAYLERIATRATGRAGFGIGVLWRGEQDRAEGVRRHVGDPGAPLLS